MSDKNKILLDSIKKFNAKIDSQLTDPKILDKTFMNRLEVAKPEPSLLSILRDKWKSFSTMFLTLFSLGFLLARLTMPVGIATKGVTDQNYIDELPADSVLIESEDNFYKVINLAVTENLKVSIDNQGSYKELFIQSLRKDNHQEIKSLLSLESTYEGPVTIVIKISK